MFVVDASVVLAWVFEDESNAAADAVLDRLGKESAVAPAHWPLEVANALRTAERRGRLVGTELPGLRTLLADLPIEIVPVELGTAMGDVLSVAREHNLSAYDAVYLSLAAFRDIPLATIDTRLSEACARAGVEVIGT